MACRDFRLVDCAADSSRPLVESAEERPSYRRFRSTIFHGSISRLDFLSGDDSLCRRDILSNVRPRVARSPSSTPDALPRRGHLRAGRMVLAAKSILFRRRLFVTTWKYSFGSRV